eukprot:GFKZ01003164.1.p1 GENE.GFKZ01003164.1~~GFKZ01003164.1.p1  ORF type:complete len:131 (-),score=2.37 GFKZ01003164.1:138-530(-)
MPPNRRNTTIYAVGSYISSDSCGPSFPTSKHGSVHFMTFTDAESRYVRVYFLKHRNQVEKYLLIQLNIIRTTRTDHHEKLGWTMRRNTHRTYSSPSTTAMAQKSNRGQPINLRKTCTCTTPNKTPPKKLS